VLAGARGKEAGYVFDRQPGGAWLQTARLTLPAAAGNSALGYSVALDGDRALLGAPVLDAGGQDSGAAVLFERQPGGAWREIARFVASDFAAADFVGETVALDGDRIAFAATQKNSLGAVYTADRAPFLRGAQGVSLTAGGSQDLLLRAGPSFAGQIYLVLGSLSGTDPGVPIWTLNLPLNPDPYLEITLLSPAATLMGSFGVLDSAGCADAVFGLPGGLDPTFAGLVAHHAFVLFDTAAAPLTASAVSNPTAVTFLP
jgi:hypothetical protein